MMKRELERVAKGAGIGDRGGWRGRGAGKRREDSILASHIAAWGGTNGLSPICI